jgi:hypothetical protein
MIDIPILSDPGFTFPADPVEGRTLKLDFLIFHKRLQLFVVPLPAAPECAAGLTVG